MRFLNRLTVAELNALTLDELNELLLGDGSLNASSTAAFAAGVSPDNPRLVFLALTLLAIRLGTVRHAN